MSLLWLIAVTAILVLLQWPTELQWLVVVLWGMRLVWHPERPNFSLDISQEVLCWHRKGVSGELSLLYQTQWWCVVILYPDRQQPLCKRLLHHLCRYRWLYRDHLMEADYRYLRSRLNVEKLLGLPTQKSGSAALK